MIDPDVVTDTSLNRLHGSTRRDAEHKRPKVAVLKDHIDQMGLGTQVAVRQASLVDAIIARLLRSCGLRLRGAPTTTLVASFSTVSPTATMCRSSILAYLSFPEKTVG